MRRIPSYYAGINGTAAAYVQQKRTTEVKAFNNTPPPVSALLFSFFFVVPAFKKNKKTGQHRGGSSRKARKSHALAKQSRSAQTVDSFFLFRLWEHRADRGPAVSVLHNTKGFLIESVLAKVPTCCI